MNTDALQCIMGAECKLYSSVTYGPEVEIFTLRPMPKTHKIRKYVC